MAQAYDGMMTAGESLKNVEDEWREAGAAGASAFHQGRFDEAVRQFNIAVELGGGRAADLNNLGQALRAAGHLGDAAAAFVRAADQDKQFAEPLNHLGALSKLAERWDDALGYYHQALVRDPNYAEAHFNLALAFEAMEDEAKALDHYRQAVSLRAGYVAAINNLAVLLSGQGALSEAVALLKDGIERQGQAAELHASLGTCLQAQGHSGEAVAAFETALQLDPSLTEARWNLALIQLADGEFWAGWENYRSRPSVVRDDFPVPADRGADDLNGRGFEIHAEQGLGDELFFLRFVPALVQRGAAVRYIADPMLKSLTSRIPVLNEVSDRVNQWESLTIADLPYLLGSGETPPSVQITADPARRDKMAARLAEAGDPPYIGLTYRAGRKLAGALYKEVPLAELGRALSGITGTIINVQRAPEDGDSDLLEQALGRGAADFTADNDDLEDMLALMALLDDYIGVSNTNMHLRATAGKPARVLVTHPAEYRWMSAGTSPWFPDFALYRQTVAEGWSPAFADLSADLASA